MRPQLRGPYTLVNPITGESRRAEKQAQVEAMLGRTSGAVSKALTGGGLCAGWRIYPDPNGSLLATNGQRSLRARLHTLAHQVDLMRQTVALMLEELDTQEKAAG